MYSDTAQRRIIFRFLNFWLNSNSFSSAIPSQLGNLYKLINVFRLDFNQLWARDGSLGDTSHGSTETDQLLAQRSTTRSV